MGCGVVLMSTRGENDKWVAAGRKARDPNMSVNGNPLREDVDPAACMVNKNMDALMEDARRWNDQRSGVAYRAIRSMTYNGGE